MDLKTFIFIGKSGCGKGTQAKLLQDYLKENDPQTPILYIETGARFRSFLKEDNYTSSLSREIYKKGGLQPAFLAVKMWADALKENFNGKEHLFFDGTPRKLREAYTLEDALDFYGRSDVYVVYIDVSREWSKERLLGRGREDDADQEIEKRLDWYDSEVAPIIDYYKDNQKYKFLNINGEQSIENVHEEIMASVFK